VNRYGPLIPAKASPNDELNTFVDHGVLLLTMIARNLARVCESGTARLGVAAAGRDSAGT